LKVRKEEEVTDRSSIPPEDTEAETSADEVAEAEVEEGEDEADADDAAAEERYGHFHVFLVHFVHVPSQCTGCLVTH
jgi:hypothetical protein